MDKETKDKIKKIEKETGKVFVPKDEIKEFEEWKKEQSKKDK